MEHTVEPKASTIRYDEGYFIGEDLARCVHCSRWISGDDNGWWHLSASDIYDLGL